MTLYHPETGKRQDVPSGSILLRFALLNSGWLQDDSAPVVGEIDESTLDVWRAAIDLQDLAQHMFMVRLLVAAGYASPESVQMATDDELLDIKGIGPKSLAALRSVLGAG